MPPNALIRLATVCCALVFASHACGQKVGSYTGQTDDGNYASAGIGPDGAGGFVIDYFYFGVSAKCSDGSIVNTTIGDINHLPVMDRKVGETAVYFNGVTRYGLTFSKSGDKARGKAGSDFAAIKPVDAKPTGAIFCKSPSQGVTLTYTGQAQSPPPGPSGGLWIAEPTHQPR